jgi:hypothetical protein
VTAVGLTADVVTAVKGPLAELGFKKRSGEVFTCVLESDVLGWVGLNRAYRQGEDRLEVNPVVGVRHQGVERVVAELRGQMFHPYQPPTVSTPLTYLAPAARYAPWLFDRGPTIPEVAVALVRAVAEHGVPFMRVSMTLGQLRELIERGQGFAHQLVYRQPVVLLLMGDHVGALRSLDDALAVLGDRGDVAAVEFRSFAERLRQRLDQVA